MFPISISRHNFWKDKYRETNFMMVNTQLHVQSVAQHFIHSKPEEVRHSKGTYNTLGDRVSETNI